MHFSRQARRAALGLAIAGCAAHAAMAADAPAPAADTPSATSANPLGARPPVSADTLARSRGGTQVFNDMKLRGVVADNQAIDVKTGANVISDGALAGAAGLPMVIQNSGNNVLIQNATIVNVQVK